MKAALKLESLLSKTVTEIEGKQKPVRATITLYPIGRPVRATITLYPIGRPVRATITLYPIGRPVRATITLYIHFHRIKINQMVILIHMEKKLLKKIRH